MISVAMTSYNGEKYIKQQIESILSQSVPVDEVVICDDISKDKTAEIIKEINDDRIRFIVNETNLGFIANFHKSISLTNGDYIFLADQDDIWEPNKIERILDTMKAVNAKAICTNYKLIDGNGQPLGDKREYNIPPFVKNVTGPIQKITFSMLAYTNLVQGCTYCFTKEIKDIFLRVNNKFVPHDYQIMLIAANLNGTYFLNEELIQYRLHETNTIGFSKGNEKVVLNKPKKKPLMVELMDEIDSVTPIKNKWCYNLLYYFRIPILTAWIKSHINL